jgi:hypothetical protein
MLLESCILTHGKLGHLVQIEGRFLNDVYHYSFIQYFWFNCEVSTAEVRYQIPWTVLQQELKGEWGGKDLRTFGN